jgi:hypothetical protein
MTLAAIIFALQMMFGTAPTQTQVDAAVYQYQQNGGTVTYSTSGSGAGNGGLIVVQDQQIIQ